MAEKDGYAGLERALAACAACEASLAGEALVYAALFPEGDGFLRKDFCAKCFQALPERPFSFWRRAASAIEKGVLDGESKDARRARRRKDLDALVELFERLEDPPPERAEDALKLRYLLALALVRKKRLHLVDLAREGGADCLVIRTSGEAELTTVPAPALSKEDMERLAVELSREVGLS